MSNRAKRREARGASNVEVTSDLGFGKRNVALFVAGLVSIALGYVFLAQGSITAAPMLLVLGYVVFMLLAIVL